MRQIFPHNPGSWANFDNTFGPFPPNVPTMDSGLLISFLAIDLLLVCVPGADWAYAISAGLRDRSPVTAVAGLVTGYALHTVLAVAGLAVLVASVGTWLVFRIARGVGQTAMDTGFRWGQIGTASLVSLAHGANDAQKTMGVVTLALIAAGAWTSTTETDAAVEALITLSSLCRSPRVGSGEE